MSKRFTRKPSNPVPWEGAGLGLDPTTTTRGALEAAVRQAFPDVTLIELAWAMPPLPAPGWLQPDRSDEAAAVVARGRAFREARGGRPDLAEDDWLQLVRLVHPTLSEQEQQNPKDILAAVAALRPPREPDAPLARRGPGRPPWTEALFLEHWHEAVSEAAPAARLADIAACFRRMNGARGVDPDHLRRLRESFTEPTFIPE